MMLIAMSIVLLALPYMVIWDGRAVPQRGEVRLLNGQTYYGTVIPRWDRRSEIHTIQGKTIIISEEQFTEKTFAPDGRNAFEKWRAYMPIVLLAVLFGVLIPHFTLNQEDKNHELGRIVMK